MEAGRDKGRVREGLGGGEEDSSPVYNWGREHYTRWGAHRCRYAHSDPGRPADKGTEALARNATQPGSLS